jgi:hypothetical protein
MYNAGQQNQVGQLNTQTKNAAQQRNLNLAQQQYENELRKRGLVTGAQQNLADAYRNEAAINRQVVGGLIGAGAKYFGGKGE